MDKLFVEPIGVVRTPFADRAAAPRQAALEADTAARIELVQRADFLDALVDLERWSHLWVIYWFHENHAWRPKVTPPRSEVKRGVFATRAPHRPNAIGLSAVALERVDGWTLHIRGADMIDGTPVLDLKPYIPYADSLPQANSGWLDDAGSGFVANSTAPARDPGLRYAVTFTARAQEQLAWLREHGVELETDAVRVLSAGATPHAYRRIRRDGPRLRLGLRDFRLFFTLAGTQVAVEEVQTGYRARVLADPDAVPKAATPLAVHRAFVQRFGSS